MTREVGLCDMRAVGSPPLSEAYVIGLLTDLEAQLPELSRELETARARASRIDTELSSLLARLDASRATSDELRRKSDEAAATVADKNSRTAAVHQELAGIKKRADDLKLEMERVGPGAIYNRLRRDRARLLVQIEDRDKELAALKEAVERARQELAACEQGLVAEKDKHRALVAELDRLQAQLPAPHLYLRLFEATAARAHCRLHLDHAPLAWAAELRRAIALIRALHQELRAGKYRLDKNSDVVGGRATATAEALYGAVALGDLAEARALFALATDPALLFDHIFNVFRVWCLGLYLTNRRAELEALLHRHRWSPGLRGGYVQCFVGLLARDARRTAAGLKAIARDEWEVWQDPKLVRGAGVVNLGAAALGRLAQEAGLRVAPPGPTVPSEVLPSMIAGKR